MQACIEGAHEGCRQASKGHMKEGIEGAMKEGIEGADSLIEGAYHTIRRRHDIIEGRMTKSSKGAHQ
jgi:hypothetical protein